MPGSGPRRAERIGAGVPGVPRSATLAEARALAHPLRLRILRLCLDQALTNKELATRLERRPATVLHHVRALLATGFLAEEPSRPGPRGAREKPYRATGKSWRMDVTDTGEASAVRRAVLDAVAAEIDEAGEEAVLESARMALRLQPAELDNLQRRLRDLIGDYSRSDDPAGDPVAMLIMLHRR